MSSEKQYITAFNNGYILAGHEPNLARTLSQNVILNNNYWEGVLAGIEQLQVDIVKNQIHEIEKLRNNLKSNNRDVGRD